MSSRSPAGRYPAWLIGLTVAICAVGLLGAGYLVYRGQYGYGIGVFIATIVAAVLVPRGLRARASHDQQTGKTEVSLEAESAKLKDPKAGVSEERGPARDRDR